MSRFAYTDCDPLIVGCTLYQSASLTDPWGAGIYYDGVDCWQVNSSGVITGTTSCVPIDCTGPNCRNWQYSSIPLEGDIVYYYSCVDGTLQSIVLSGGDPDGNFCNCNTQGNPFTNVSPGGTTLTEIGTCGTTTTTTAPPPTCYENTTINVTDTGWIRWTSCDGTVVNYFINTLGTFTITDCIQSGTIRIATPLADLASWNNVVNGTACGTTTTTTTAAPTTTTTTAATTTTTTTTPQQKVSWSYARTTAPSGTFILYVNNVAVETRFNSDSGEYIVQTGDEIYIEVGTDGCTNPDNVANAYTIATNPYNVLTDAACSNGSTSLLTNSYFVGSGDTTISVAAFSRCDTGCV